MNYTLAMPETPESKRFNTIFKRERWTQTELASTLGYKDSSVVNLYLNGSRKIADQFLLKLQNKTGYSAQWIRMGVGPERITVRDSDLDIPDQVSEAAATYNPDRTPFNVSNQISRESANMWLVPIRAQAGFAKRFDDPVFLNQMQRVPFPMVMGECFCFEVEGRSMEPKYAPHSWVVCKLIDDASWLAKGRNYVFQTYEGIYIKQFDRVENNNIYMVSINKEYNPVDPLPLGEVRRLYSIEGRYLPE